MILIVVYILLALVGIVLLALFVNFNFILEYDGVFKAHLRILFVKLNITKLAERVSSSKEPKKKKPQKSEKQQEKKSKKKKKTISEVSEFVKFVTKIVRSAAGKLSKKLKIRLCYLEIRVAASEADKTALTYGAVAGAVAILDDVCAQFVNYKSDPEKIAVYPDFTSSSTDGRVKIILTIKPVHALSIALTVLAGVVKTGGKIRIDDTNNGKDGKKDE